MPTLSGVEGCGGDASVGAISSADSMTSVARKLWAITSSMDHLAKEVVGNHVVDGPPGQRKLWAITSSMDHLAKG